jgi:hypothetical protein
MFSVVINDGCVSCPFNDGCVSLWLRLPVLGILLNVSTVKYVHLLLLFNFRSHLLSLAFYKPKEPLIERIRDP